ncbi:hypothetical protein ABPG75_004934 [Micractinium tetrahymenae]
MHPELAQMLDRHATAAVKQVSQGSTAHRAVSVASSLLKVAAMEPRIAAALVAGGTARAAHKAAARTGNADEVPRLILAFYWALSRLDSAADRECAADDAAGKESVVQLSAAAAQLRACLPLLKDRRSDGEPQQLVSCLQQEWLPHAVATAQALQRRWEEQQAGRQAAAQLELAQAAATRCCAYLRCPNLGAEGGPAAGQQPGSKRCGRCRAVWYCGTDCSHADWRAGGHRKVCSALAAARQQLSSNGSKRH